MPENRFFADTPFDLDLEFILEEQEHHHLNVMRAKKGDCIEIVNGKGVLALAKILSLSKKSSDLKITSILKKEPPAFHPIIIIQALPRFTRIATILEKGTELGMDEIWFFPGEKSEQKTLTFSQLLRLKHIAIAAMKQSGRLYLPKIEIASPLTQWKSLPYPSYFGDLSNNAPLFRTVFQISNSGSAFFIGPESGFSDQEENILRNLGAKGVNLHPNILRTDTASLAALSLMSHFLQK